MKMRTELTAGARAGKRSATMILIAVATLATAGIVSAAPTPITAGGPTVFFYDSALNTQLIASTAPPAGTATTLAPSSFGIGIGTIGEIVYNDSSTGGLDFFFQVNPASFSSDGVHQVTLQNFAGTVTGVGYDSSAIAGSGSTPDNLDPVSANLSSDGTTVDFNFNNPPGFIANNTSSDWLEVYTKATTTSLGGSVLIQDGSQAKATIVTPAAAVPETKNLLFGLAIACVIGVGALRKSSQSAFGNTAGFAV